LQQSKGSLPSDHSAKQLSSDDVPVAANSAEESIASAPRGDHGRQSRVILLKVRRTPERGLREFPKRSHCPGHPITVDSVQARCSLDSPLKHSHIEEQLELPTDRRLRHL